MLIKMKGKNLLRKLVFNLYTIFLKKVNYEYLFREF